ncbi:hypothetical protein NP493_250g04052 [Ridgeia piscesae]|uniref:Serine-threonine/tyrosine-protein kinase catalytic domain-containing protein n=1 Tax=Ridgeia piscesae TaxID=27915 RepID=A0AAD9UD13_RIDPI|nr:hypothetical protein NP493_250g04052 [Ridgeia piscesae]
MTQKSDAYSYGTVIWELENALLQPAVTPISHLAPYFHVKAEKIAVIQRQRHLLPQPKHCPDWLYRLVKALMANPSCRRPSFQDAIWCLTKQEFPIARLEQTNSQKKLKRITMMIETEDKKLRFDSRGTLHDQKRRRTMSPTVSLWNEKAATTKPAAKSWRFLFSKSRKPDKKRIREPPSAADVSVPSQLDTDEQDWSERSRESVTRSRESLYLPVPEPHTQAYQDEQAYPSRGPVAVLHTQAYQDEHDYQNIESVPVPHTQDYPDEQAYPSRGPVAVLHTQAYQDEHDYQNIESVPVPHTQDYPDEQAYPSRGPVAVPHTQAYQDEHGWNDREGVLAHHPQADTDGQDWNEIDGEPYYRDSGPQQTPDPQIEPYHTATVGDPVYCTLQPEPEVGARRQNGYCRIEEEFV